MASAVPRRLHRAQDGGPADVRGHERGRAPAAEHHQRLGAPRHQGGQGRPRRDQQAGDHGAEVGQLQAHEGGGQRPVGAGEGDQLVQLAPPGRPAPGGGAQAGRHENPGGERGVALGGDGPAHEVAPVERRTVAVEPGPGRDLGPHRHRLVGAAGRVQGVGPQPVGRQAPQEAQGPGRGQVGGHEVDDVELAGRHQLGGGRPGAGVDGHAAGRNHDRARQGGRGVRGRGQPRQAAGPAPQDGGLGHVRGGQRPQRTPQGAGGRGSAGAHRLSSGGPRPGRRCPAPGPSRSATGRP